MTTPTPQDIARAEELTIELERRRYGCITREDIKETIATALAAERSRWQAVTEEMVERFLHHWYPTINDETLALMKVNGTYKITQDGLAAALHSDSDSSDK